MTEKQIHRLEEKQKIVDLTIAYTWIIDHGPRERLREILLKMQYSLSIQDT